MPTKAHCQPLTQRNRIEPLPNLDTLCLTNCARLKELHGMKYQRNSAKAGLLLLLLLSLVSDS